MGCGKSPASESTDLCTSCGLCCSGVVYDSVPFPFDETAAVEELGLSPYQDPPGQMRFDLPCRHLRQTMCGVFERRPSPCGAFRCELLIALETGTLSLREAKATVEEAKAMIARIVPLMDAEGGPITPKRWGVLLDQWQAQAQAGLATAGQAKLVLELAILNRFLDTHFRDGKQQVLRPKHSPKKVA